MSITDDFCRALTERSIIPPSEIIADGRIYRCAVEGARHGKLDASYLLHLDGFPAGGFENFRDGFGWQKWRADARYDLTLAERAAYRQRIEATKEARQLDEQHRRIEAQQLAGHLWQMALPASNSHSYLFEKGVKAFGLRALHDKLVIPLRDSDHVLWSLQFIGPSSEKRFLTGGKKRGCYFAIGRVVDVICICEGYATAASVFESTGHATAVAFDAGNLEPVARALRRKFPGVTIIIAADNDVATPGNPGVTKALDAARAVQGRVAIPTFVENPA